MPHENRVHRRVDGGRGRRVGDLEIDDLVCEPFLEASDALGQVAAGLVLGVRDGEDGDFGKRVLEERFEVRGEVSWRSVSFAAFASMRADIPNVSSPPCVFTLACYLFSSRALQPYALGIAA
jgi:hypothetical protein